MKKLFYLVIPAMMFFACNNNVTTTEEETADKKECENEKRCKDVMTVDSLLNNLEMYVDKNVEVCGQCIHVCQHSGKNIFVANPDNDSILIIGKVNDELGAFDQELMDKRVILYGILKSVEVENEEAEVHHDIVVQYYIEVSKVEQCGCGDKKHKNGCGEHKEDGRKDKTTE